MRASTSTTWVARTTNTFPAGDAVSHERAKGRRSEAVRRRRRRDDGSDLGGSARLAGGVDREYLVDHSTCVGAIRQLIGITRSRNQVRVDSRERGVASGAAPHAIAEHGPVGSECPAE